MHTAADIYGFAGIAEASRAIQEGRLKSVELVQECLDRIKMLNPKLNPFTILEEEAIKCARLADEEIKSGQIKSALHGIPVAVQDLYDTKGIRTTAGLDRLKNRIPDSNAGRFRDPGSALRSNPWIIPSSRGRYRYLPYA